MKNHFDISDTFTIENNVKVYQMQRCFKYLEKQGKKTYGQSFAIHEQDRSVILKLLVYAIRDKESALKLGIDLNKGIALTGPVGCGKTSLMHLIKPFIYAKHDYKIKTTREVAFEFAKNGYDALSQYSSKLNNLNRLSGFCFDDLGSEKQIKHFGSECNVMAEILLSRYDKFVENNAVTHITTNLSASEIEKIYGNRLRSRMREMFNLIAFDSSSLDKRT
ncbi:ATPase [Flavobacterium sp. SM15]|uniref:ATPase n=1 Tax=Flavobacterium sp. SM15 TaxID=2908005 RepID=UPI001EDBB5DE|nr:ATPase [Flavobacterium sp. SM15]MCG2611838.1 ATPase [Flavobacterium sp. SM15]